MTLITGISGVRGISGDSLTDKVISDFAKAFATFLKKGIVVIGRDTRPSGNKIKDIVISELNRAGLDVVDLGICPTPTVQFMVKKLNADGGIIITASHNPGQWNGLKFARRGGMFLNADEAGLLIKIYESGKFIISNRTGSTEKCNDPFGPHIKKVLECVDVTSIRKRKFRVALDSCNGAGSVITVKLLKELGCDVIELSTSLSGSFPRNPEPTPENLKGLCEKVKESGADIGFAQDADADRLALVTDKGIAPGEEYTLAIVVDHVLSRIELQGKEKGRPVVTNLSTSMMIDDVAKDHGAKVIRTKIGEINVTEEIIKQKAVIGGEGNGGIIYPKVVSSRDSLTGIALILESLSLSGKSITSVISSMRKYFIVKKKMDCPSKAEAVSFINKVKSRFPKEKLDLTEGIKVTFKDAWVHARASNTEPIIRIIAEAESSDRARELISEMIG